MARKLFWSVLVLLPVTAFVVGASTNYTKDALRKKFPDYGVKWMYFPDGNGVPTVGYLELPSDDLATSSDPIDPEKSLTFRLYSRIHKAGLELSATNKALMKSEFSVDKDTKFVTHGWLSSGQSDTCQFIKDAFLMKADFNVIILDWSEIANNIFYPVPMAHTKEIGSHYAKFIGHLLDLGARPSSFHLIGHSLGAHVSGFASRFVTQNTGQNLSRITALDPALPGFIHGINVDRLSPTDADFVDVIHTCGGVLGIMQNLGHVDFYPNGGEPPQPGCSGLAEVVESCSHGRSWKYFAESILSERKFMAQKCKSWNDYVKKSCDNERVPMGNPVPTTARGSYYLDTEAAPPYARRLTNFTVMQSNELNK